MVWLRRKAVRDAHFHLTELYADQLMCLDNNELEAARQLGYKIIAWSFVLATDRVFWDEAGTSGLSNRGDGGADSVDHYFKSVAKE
jgi:hypothetical protein